MDKIALDKKDNELAYLLKQPYLFTRLISNNDYDIIKIDNILLY